MKKTLGKKENVETTSLPTEDFGSEYLKIAEEMPIPIHALEDMKYSHLTKKEKEAKIESIRTEPKFNRNQLCPCGSGKKYKKCCLTK